MRWTLVAAWVAFALAACSSDEASSPSEPGGTLELGAVCASSSECKQQADKEIVCDCADGASETVCVALPSEGEPCGGDIVCGAGSVCAITGPGGAMCRGYAREGESCVDAWCAAGTACDGTVCGPPRAIGESCDNFDEQPCVEGTVCGFFDGVCVAGTPDGAPCGNDLPDCLPGAACVSTQNGSTCRRPQPAGAPCETSLFDCEDGLECEEDANGEERCTPRTTPVKCGF